MKNILICLLFLLPQIQGRASQHHHQYIAMGYILIRTKMAKARSFFIIEVHIANNPFSSLYWSEYLAHIIHNAFWLKIITGKKDEYKNNPF